MNRQSRVKVARIYDEPSDDDGARVLVEFRDRYLGELENPDRTESLEGLRDLAARGPVTLLTATKRPEISEAAVLAEVLLDSTTGLGA